ncbi:5-methylcytosine-specific restriction protein B [Lipingzhangella halophila]|uniref:5-methylcytosine-specific restriction protein B n=1 Tax=Lipingzhangella halophila TaxID=1783352 RepID=A0A7W7W372_9ACTN|nr:AAA family ATPase [Lipingzhangella halophila]MBB4932742.1 5-methylcytosine-specific restriction protein B [Lipingzhangella halophila]
MANGIDLSRAAAEFDPADARERVERARDDRQRVTDEFPLDRWPTLALESYALGAAPQEGTGFCRLMEFGTEALGSIRGGSAAKHIIYLHNDGRWRLSGPLVGMEAHSAWERLRTEFVAAFEAAEAEDFDALDDLGALRFGQALVTKTLAAYFPQHFLPVYSAAHIRHFIELFGGATYQAYAGSEWAWGANRRLYDLVYRNKAFREWDPDTVIRFLYQNYDPRQSGRAVYKIAPGRQAEMWPECRDNGFICVGWDEVGDLESYENDAELKTALDTHRPERPGGHRALARNLLAFRDLHPGDVIVANRGKSEILALGTVSGAYVHDTARERYRNTVPVDWDESYAQTLEPPEAGWRQTFAKVKPLLMHRIEANRAGRGGTPAEEPAPAPQVRRILDVLDAKGQAILYGPPGTGKTRAALSAALACAGRPEAADYAAEDRRRAIADLLDGAASGKASVRMVTFHPSYGYEDFVEGYKPAPAADGSGLNLQLTDGIFLDVCREADDSPDRRFLLIIDELNRGDLPRIFGELVTFLEKDKRGVPVTLPVSKRPFRIPPNVVLLATMNTADRSVGHMDAAIRRRFGFVELGPDLDAVAGTVGPLPLATFLGELNLRITRHLDADHQLGHAYLMRDDEPLYREEDLASAFYTDIAPLLVDHCLGRAELLHSLLGPLLDPDTGAPNQMAAGDLARALAAEFAPEGDDGDSD